MPSKGKGKAKQGAREQGEASNRARRGQATSSNEPSVRLSSHGFQLLSDEESDRYNILKGLKIKVNRRIDWEALEHYDLADGLRNLLIDRHWFDFVNLQFVEYSNLILEFLISVFYDKNKDQLVFRFQNVQHALTLTDFGNLLGMPRRGLQVRADIDFDAEAVWKEMTESDDVYVPGLAKATSIRQPKYKLLHKVVVHFINVRSDSFERVQRDDLFFMWCIKNDKRIDIPAILTDHLLTNAIRTRGGIVGGGYICHIAAKHCGIHLNNEEKRTYLVPFLPQKHLISHHLLQNIGLIESVGYVNNRMKYKRVALSSTAPPAAATDDTPGDGDDHTRRKPPTTVSAGGTSTQVRSVVGPSSSAQGTPHVIYECRSAEMNAVYRCLDRIDNMLQQLSEDQTRILQNQARLEQQIRSLRNHEPLTPPPSTDHTDGDA